MRPIHSLLARRTAAARRDERGGNIALMTIIALPAMWAMFSFGIDTSKNLYLRSAIQSALDTATASGASVTVDGGTTSGVYLDTANFEPFKTIEDHYTTNRPNGLTCLSTGGTPAASIRYDGLGPLCYQRVSAVTSSAPFNVVCAGTLGRPRYVEYTVVETSRNFFLTFLGTEVQQFRVSSRACVRQGNT